MHLFVMMLSVVVHSKLREAVVGSGASGGSLRTYLALLSAASDGEVAEGFGRHDSVCVCQYSSHGATTRRPFRYMPRQEATVFPGGSAVTIVSVHASDAKANGTTFIALK